MMRLRMRRNTLTAAGFIGALACLLLPAVSAAAADTEALLRAIRSGDLAGADKWLDQHAGLNRRLPDGSTPLSWAVETQSPDMVRLLLDHGAKANGVGDDGVAPLMIACEYGDAEILDLLLKARAAVNIKRADGITPLALCAGSAPAAIVARMIARGAVVDQADVRGQTPVMFAAAKGRVDNIGLLRQRGAQINRKTQQGMTPLFFALKSSVPAAPLAVLAAGGDADYIAPDGTTAVQLAMYQQDYAFAARMIERGADLQAADRQGNRLLHAAILAKQPALVQQLIAKGADANASTAESKIKLRFESNFKTGDYAAPLKTPLQLATEQGSVEMMQMLLAAGARTDFVDAEGTTIVLAAAASGKLSALQLALRLAPDANVTAANGQTPLHVLLSMGSGGVGGDEETVSMMKLLAEHGARTDIKDHSGQTAADIAADPQFKLKAAYDHLFGNTKVTTL